MNLLSADHGPMSPRHPAYEFLVFDFGHPWSVGYSRIVLKHFSG